MLDVSAAAPESAPSASVVHATSLSALPRVQPGYVIRFDPEGKVITMQDEDGRDVFWNDPAVRKLSVPFLDSTYTWHHFVRLVSLMLGIPAHPLGEHTFVFTESDFPAHDMPM